MNRTNALYFHTRKIIAKQCCNSLMAELLAYIAMIGWDTDLLCCDWLRYWPTLLWLAEILTSIAMTGQDTDLICWDWLNYLPSHLISAPGAKPTLQVHVKPPSLLVHVPLPHAPVTRHSLSSVTWRQQFYVAKRKGNVKSTLVHSTAACAHHQVFIICNTINFRAGRAKGNSGLFCSITYSM